MSSEQTESDRRAESRDKLQTLIEARTETLSLYNQLAAMRPFTVKDDVQLLLQEFCEALVDYTASAHFQLYRFIEEGTERRQPVREIADRVYPQIEKTTSYIVDFNDKYDSDNQSNNMSKLADDLSDLGEVLADRITFEDQVISAFRSVPEGS